MVCPKCGGKTKVSKTANIAEDNEIYRRRVCLDCNHAFYTVEFEADFTEEYKVRWHKAGYPKIYGV